MLFYYIVIVKKRYQFLNKMKEYFQKKLPITMPREQMLINSNLDVFFNWFSNELMNIPNEFSLIDLSNDAEKKTPNEFSLIELSDEEKCYFFRNQY